MEWHESDPLPDECKNCTEEDCYNCDYALNRWHLSEQDQLNLKRLKLLQSMEHTWDKIIAIDIKMLPFSKEQAKALHGNAPMTFDLFKECLDVCNTAGNVNAYYDIWRRYPQYIKMV